MSKAAYKYRCFSQRPFIDQIYSNTVVYLFYLIFNIDSQWQQQALDSKSNLTNMRDKNV